MRLVADVIAARSEPKASEVMSRAAITKELVEIVSGAKAL
jgi:hypothetical protein